MGQKSATLCVFVAHSEVCVEKGIHLSMMVVYG